MNDEVLSFYAVRPSALHGMGLFATQWIRQDAVIGTVQGPATDEDGPHVLWVDERIGYRVDNDMRYINHHLDPNACYYDDLTVVARATSIPVKRSRIITAKTG